MGWGAAGLLVVGAGIGGYLAVQSNRAGHHRSARPPVSRTLPPPRLAVVDATITVSPAGGQLGCGDGRATYQAKLTTNGAAGALDYQWTYPDGSPGPSSRMQLAKGQKSVALSLQYTFSGTGQASGMASLQVQPVGDASHSAAAPIRTEAPPVDYHCG